MSRAFLICPEPVREITAGVGSRFLALARELVAAGHRVTLVVPNDPAEAAAVGPGVDLVRADPDRLGAQADGHDWVLLQGYLGNHYLCQRSDLPVVVDLYDPFLVENLHYYPDLGLEPWVNDHATWRLQMSSGDLFLCSSEEQRLYYLGWLTALGRVNPLLAAADPTAGGLLVELPFGTPDGEPPPAEERSRVLPGAAGPVIYFGGIYDWYDPLVLLEALPEVLAHHPGVVVVFVDHPHKELTPLSLEARVRAAAEERGWLGTSVRFVPWRPFAERFVIPGVCDLAVVTHRPGLETTLSLRTRVVDLLWLGLAVVSTAGGTMARVVAETGAGEVVPPADPVALAATINGLLGDDGRRRQAGDAARRWAATRSWPRVAAPLLEFADDPHRDLHKGVVDAATGNVVVKEPVRNWLRRVMGRRRGRS